MTTTLTALALFACACQTEKQGERPDETNGTEKTSTSGVTNANDGAPDEPEPEPEPELAPALPAPEAPAHAVYDMLVNRPIAHRIHTEGERTTLTIDATAPDFARYIHGNHMGDWLLGVEADGQLAAALDGREAAIHLPNWSAGQAVTVTMRWHNPTAAAQTIALLAGKKKLGEATFEPGWSTGAIELPADVSTHELSLRIKASKQGSYGKKKKSGGALAWASVGAPIEGEPSREAGGAQGALSLATGHGLSYTLWALPSSHVDVTMKGAPGCGIQARLFHDEGGTPVVAKEWTRALVEGRGDSQTTTIDLSEFAGEKGKLGRLDVTALPECEGGVELTSAALTLPGERPAMPTEWEAPKVIVFWKADALRADYLSFYDPDHGVETPAFDDIAAKGANFKIGFVEGNESRVSHASMFSGLFPKRHGVHPKGKLKPKLLLLTEALQAAGYRTVGRASNGYVSKTYGYVQGWDSFSNDLKENLAYKGKHLVKRALRDIKKYEGEPIFLYVGSIDTHVTYRAHKGIIEKYHDGKGYTGPYKRAITGMDFRRIWRGEYRPNAADKERAKALYKNEITYNDEAFAELRAGLEEAGLWDDTMVVITSDHGDELWEHGKVGHGHNLFQELVHIPLIVYYPKLIPANTEVWSGADVLDLYPTIMATVRGERPAEIQGKNLLEDVFMQRGDYPEPATSNDELKYYTQQLRHYKLILRQGTHWFYDRSVDHYEKKKATGSNPLAERWLLDSVSLFRANREAWDKSTWGAPTNLKAGALEKMKQ